MPLSCIERITSVYIQSRHNHVNLSCIACDFTLNDVHIVKFHAEVSPYSTVRGEVLLTSGLNWNDQFYILINLPWKLFCTMHIKVLISETDFEGQNEPKTEEEA